MRWGTSRPAVASMPHAATATETAVWAGSAPRRAAGWERRLYAGLRIEGEPIELSLRRCGYAYRHVVAAHLASHVEAIGEHLTLILHALSTLPPAGTLPASTLRAGLDELTSGLQGYIVPTHLVGLSQRTPGLLWGIAQLRALDAHEETSLESDIAWAHAQDSLARQPHPSTQVGTIAAVNVRSSHAPARSAAAAAQEWRDTISALERLRQR